MKKLLTAALIATAMAAFPVVAHHAAEGMVDDEVYEMIDTLLMDAPHAEMTVDDIAVGMTDVTTTTITTNSVTSMENMIGDGLLDYASHAGRRSGSRYHLRQHRQWRDADHYSD